jgi:hypothetical protein
MTTPGAEASAAARVTQHPLPALGPDWPCRGAGAGSARADGDLRHAGYIASWIGLLKAEPRAFFTACSN